MTTDEALEITINTIEGIVVLTTELKTQIRSIITRTVTSTEIDLTKLSSMTKDFSENIHFGNMNLLLNSSMSVKTANQAHSNMRPTLQQDTKSYNTQKENNVRWIQQEENNADNFDAISDLFSLN